jgi:hypothetical protein
MTYRRIGRLGGRAAWAGLIALAALLAARPARAVVVTCGNGSGIGGQTVTITLSTDNVTGLNITSLQFEITYNPAIVTAVGVSEAGTSTGTAGWGNATFGVTSGKVHVSDAGTAPLAGSGGLIKVLFQINPSQLGATSTSLGLTSGAFVFNEGTPAATTVNGTLTVNATPVITVSPNTGEVIRGQTLQFSVSGNVTNPVTWSTTDNAIATINSSGLLTGVAPGTVRVNALDNAGLTDQTDGDILIRGMGLTAGTVSVTVGQTVDVPLTVTSLNGLGIRSGQVTIGFNANYASAISVQTPAGTLLNGYATPTFGTTSSSCTVAFAGTGVDLTGSGVLCYIRFQGVNPGGMTLTVNKAIFNETLTAKPTNGALTVNALPTIIVQPDQVTLLAGQTQQFTLSGSPTPPITWSVLDPLVASISGTGLLTALAGGVTKVHAVDAVGATDDNTSVTVYDFAASLGSVNAAPGTTVLVPLSSDRNLGALNIRALQFGVTFNALQITASSATTSGMVSVWGAGGLAQNPTSGSLRVAAAGTAVLQNGSTEIQWLRFTVAPGVTIGTNITLTLNNLIFNEGTPVAQLANGAIHVVSTVDVPPAGGAAFALGAAEPNPVRRTTRIAYAIPAGDAGARVRLVLYGLDGRQVRSLLDEAAASGERSVAWDGRDDAGGIVRPGLYFYRLTCGTRSLARKLAVVP